MPKSLQAELRSQRSFASSPDSSLEVKMELAYVSYDSFGVKGMCTRVETKDCTITIDPGIAAETGSFPLPSLVKMELLEKYREEIRRSAETSDTIILTHYHYDHHMPVRDPRLYGDKRLLIKDPENFVNKSQRERASNLLRVIKGLPKEVKAVDGKGTKIGGTKLKFSKPLWHGVTGTNLGYVIMVEITDGEDKLLYTSDVDGPMLEEPTRLIIKSQPDLLVLDGPPTYLLGYIMAYYNLARSIINIRRILREAGTRQIVLDHHLVRDYRYPDLMCLAYEEAKRLGKTMCSASEIMGKDVEVVVGFKRYGPTRWKNWKKFTKTDAKSVLENAVQNSLIERKWLKLLHEC